MKFTHYGQSCFTLRVGGKTLLFDPFITDNPLAKDIDVNSLEADYILVSHGHGDHVVDLVSIAKRTGARIISNVEIVNWVESQGCTNCHPMNFGSYNFDFGRVSFVPAAHSSGLPDGSYGGNPGGFVISTAEGNFYYSGDTCLIMDMQLVPHYAKLDFAILPIGGNFTMDAADAVVASDFIKCNKIIAVHFDTFGYIKIDHEDAKKKFADAGKQLILPVVGESIEV